MEDNKYVIARKIGARTFQLALGAEPLVKTEPTDRFEEVARHEYEKEILPLSSLKKKKD